MIKKNGKTLVEKYNLKNINFIDIELEGDNQIFIDPYRLNQDRENLFAINCSNAIVDFFNRLLDCAIKKMIKKLLNS